MMSSYFVVMQDYGRRGREAVVDPEMTLSNVIDRVASGEYKNIVFIHRINGDEVSDITEEVMNEADAVKDLESALQEREALYARFDHARDLRKHEAV